MAAPDRPENIFSWKLTRTTDPFDNSIEYLYERERARQAGPHRWDQTYLKAIRYGDYGDRESPQFLVYLRFFYKDRPDPFSEYRSGFEIRTTRRCYYIGVYTLADTLRFVRRYDLVYADQITPFPDWLPKNGVSLLHQVSVGGVEFPVLNRLDNGNFGQARVSGSYPEPFENKGDAASAAVAWNVRNNEPCTTHTQVAPCEYLHLKRATLRVKTTGTRSGVVHDLSPYSFPWPNVGPKVTAYAWVFVIQGTVGIGIGSGDAIQINAQISRTTGQWEYLETTGTIEPQELAVLADTPDGAEFYVADAGLALAGTNWLGNPDFGLIGNSGAETVLEGKGLKGNEPAAGWTLWNGSDATTKASIVTPTGEIPSCPGGGMAYMSIETQPQVVVGNAEPQKTQGNGLMQQIRLKHRLPSHLYVRVWVFVKKGRVSLNVRELGNENRVSATSQKINEWESLILRVDCSSEKSQGFEVSIASFREDDGSAQSTEFYVANPLAIELPPNLLLNDDFTRDTSLEPIATFVERGKSSSAALNWQVRNMVAAKTETEVLPSSNPHGGGRMLHFETEAKGNGLCQSFSALDRESGELASSLWVCVRRGRVAVRLINADDPDAAEAAHVLLKPTGKWEFVPIRNALAGTDRLLITAETDDGAEFLLDAPWVSLSPCEEWLPPLEFGYTAFEPEKRKYAPLKGELPASSLSNPNLELVDLFGNGLPDILEMNGTVRYWRNLGGGNFDMARMMREAPAESFAEAGVQLIDANGDGRSDLLVTRDGRAGYYPLAFGGRWDPKSYQPYQQAPSFNLEDPEVRLVDLDGDGVTDALRSGIRFECFFNDPHQGWGSRPDSTRRVERKEALEEFPNVNFSDPRVKWADMTGDGLQDIVLVHNGQIDYWPNLGRGNWGKRITMRKNPRFEDAGIYGAIGYDPKRILLGDVDGDGAADLVYLGSGHIMVWINQSGNGWSEPITIHGTPSITDLDAVRLTDLYGTGTAGILWTYDFNSFRDSAYKFLDLTGGVKPYLLGEMNNHTGAVTKVRYGSSTKEYLRDEKNRDPSQRWHTPLPFPVQAVTQVETIDQISKGKLTTEYCYHHGYWDGTEREFRGFGRVDQYDSESLNTYSEVELHEAEAFFTQVDRHYFSPPTLTKTWFHQGPVGDEFGEWGEPDYSHEFWSADPQRLIRPPEMEEFLKSLPRWIKRDALRALRGSVLRTELYALDGSEREDRPYTVTEQLYGLREESPLEPGDKDRLHIFFPHALAQRTTQWERGDDPMTKLTFTDDHDPLGRPLQSTAVALPRRSAHRMFIEGAVIGPINPNEERILAIHTRTGYAVPDADVYIHDRVAQVRTFELAKPPSVSESAPEDLPKVLEEQVSAARAVRVSFQEFLKNWTPGQAIPATLHLIGHTINHYDGDGFKGLAPGKLGQYGALTRSESLIFTDKELDAAYKDHDQDRRPRYLGGSVQPPDGAPESFGAQLGYRRESDSADDGHHNGYYADTQRQQFDFQVGAAQQRGLIRAIQDALDHQVNIKPDDYWLLPVEVSDPATLTTRAEYDYRILQPRKVTDPNGNSTLFLYTLLGLLHKQFLEGRAGEGGTLDKPETEYTYDFFHFERTGEPIFVHSRQRVCHAKETNAGDDLIESRECSDGFGRLIQKRTQAEELVFGKSGDDIGLPARQEEASKPAMGSRVEDRVVVSGRQVYNNKGRVVEKYEPFFDQGWAFQREKDAKQGQHASLFYDPRGQVIRTLNPDGSEQRVIFGIPWNLQTPHDFSPTPWESYTYDANDLAPLSYDPTEKQNDGSPKPLTDRAPLSHHYTPASSLLDALGRVICQMERNGPTPATDWYVTRSSYDISGNLIEIKDALGRTAFQHAYDLLNRTLRIDSIDAGLRTSVFNAAGNQVEYRDSKGSVVLREYDALNRPTRIWARNDANQSVTLRQRLIYGEDAASNGLSHDDAVRRNLLGRLYRHYDEAGLLQFDGYDFKGSITEKARRVIEDKAIADGWVANWNERRNDRALEDVDRSYRTSLRYDALNRPTEVTYPADVKGHRAKLTPHYNRAGALEKIELDGASYMTQIAYNAKGQRVLIAYGNSVMTRYVYDPTTFRLARLRTERFQTIAANSDKWTGTGEPPLQDFAHEYDLVGNIHEIHDRAPKSGIIGTPAGIDALDRAFTYDPIYRLLSATGRECETQQSNRPWDDIPRCTDLTKTRPYEEQYEYDPSSNMRKLSHTHIAVGNVRVPVNRQFELAPGSNRLRTVTIGVLPFVYDYDDNGNLKGENTERHFGWDHADRLISFINQPVGANDPTVEARYFYGADGMRVKKWERKSGSTVYIDGIFEYHRWGQLRPKENNRLHVMDNQSRIALIRVGDKDDDDGGPAIQYHLGDHLGSSHIVLGGAAVDADEFINREEYFPYGETSFGSFAKKRYRFTGKERDEESGLYYHGARYYAPWVSRWTSCDATLKQNPYLYVKNNPIAFVDPDGREESTGANRFWGVSERLVDLRR